MYFGFSWCLIESSTEFWPSARSSTAIFLTTFVLDADRSAKMMAASELSNHASRAGHSGKVFFSKVSTANLVLAPRVWSGSSLIEMSRFASLSSFFVP